MKNFIEWSVECQNTQFEAMGPPPPPVSTSQRQALLQNPYPTSIPDHSRSQKRIAQIWSATEKKAKEGDFTYQMARNKILQVRNQYPNDATAALTAILRMLRAELPPVYHQFSDRGVGPLPAPPPPPGT